MIMSLDKFIKEDIYSFEMKVDAEIKRIVTEGLSLVGTDKETTPFRKYAKNKISYHELLLKIEPDIYRNLCEEYCD